MTIYFYKAQDDYGCFSNFSPHPIEIGGQTWPTVEHYYQAHKFLGTPDEPLMVRIRQAPSPEEAARLGRDRRRQPRPDWNQTKPQLMYEAVKLKFRTHLDIQQILLDTGDEELIENSPVDYFWGLWRRWERSEPSRTDSHDHSQRITTPPTSAPQPNPL